MLLFHLFIFHTKEDKNFLNNTFLDLFTKILSKHLESILNNHLNNKALSLSFHAEFLEVK